MEFKLSMKKIMLQLCLMIDELDRANTIITDFLSLAKDRVVELKMRSLKEIVLAVQDDGKGIAPEVLVKIGTPFFITKENGTGLGLAVCYSIVARHNARIKIESSSAGSTFFVRFRKL